MFLFDEIAQRSLVHSWKEQLPDRRKEFSWLFKQLLFNTYMNQLENYTGSNEMVIYDS